MWGWLLGAATASWGLGKVAKELEREEAASRRARHAVKCELAELLKDEPAERWTSYGLDKTRTLRECGIEPDRGVTFYSSRGRGRRL